ncbi:MAG: PaaI family thioesterase [Gammaproteobacteria bacterium]|nr:PaaI family thioesterase [Gammaproteobacteria bacterium]
MSLIPTTTPALPQGFEPFNLGGGYSESFGNLYQKAEGKTRLLGFYALPQHLNHVGSCHGGALAFFADMQLVGIKSLTGNESGHFPTKQLCVDYIAPIKQGDWVEMKVELIRVTRKNVYTHAIISAAGRAVARSTAIYHVPQEN